MNTSHKNDVVVQLVLLAENPDLQAKMAMYGLETQTVEGCAPITISTDSALRDAYSSLGENAKLKLSGRPKRPVGTLSTCKLYRCQGRLYAFLPHFMDREEYYLVSDNDYFVTVFEQELAFVRNNWVGSGRPTMVVLLTAEMFGSFTRSSSEISTRWGYKAAGGGSKKNLLDFMMSLRTGICGGVRVRLGRLGEMVNTSKIESLDFLVSVENSDVEDWHSVLKCQGVGRSATSKNLPYSEDTRNQCSNENTAPRRRKSFGGSENRSKSPAKSPLTSPFYSEEASYVDFKLQAHVEPVKPSRNGATSPVRGLQRDRSLASGSLVDEEEQFTDMEGGAGRRGSFQFEVHSIPAVAGLPTRTRAEECEETNAAVEMNATSSLAESFDRPSIAIPGASAAPEILTLTLNDPANFAHAVDLLHGSSNLFDQIDILHYLYSIEGPDYVIEKLAPIKLLIEEVYIKATQLKRWSIVRQAAGLLQKVVNNLSINITELLIRQKPVTVGYGNKEFFINSPLSPAVLVDIIYRNCSSDVREAPLVQEIITYLGSFIRSSGSILEGIMRVRTHFFIIAMREEISRMKGCDEEEAIEFLMQLSPYETKSLLGQVLSAAEHLNLKSDPVSSSYSAEARWKQIQEQNTTKMTSSPDPSGVANTLKITAQSGGFHDGNFARIEVERDGHYQQIPLSFSRGLNVIVLDSLDGIVVETATFDSHMSSEESEEFARMIEWLDVGTIVVVLCKDDCTENMTEAAKLACEELGSTVVRTLNYRDSWCLIGEKGSELATESHKKSTLGSSQSISKTINLSERRQRIFASIPENIGVSTQDIFSHGPNMNLFMPSHGRWIRRRKNDGALNRVPPLFYPKVWTVLSKCEGIFIGRRYLPRDPTISEKTPEEFSFGLEFESLLDVIRDPAERQMAVDCLVVIYWLSTNNPEHIMNPRPLMLLDVLKDAMQSHWNYWAKQAELVKASLSLSTTSVTMLKNGLNSFSTGFGKNELFARRLFFDLPSFGAEGSNSYLAASCIKIVFDGKLVMGKHYDVATDFCE